SRPTAGWRRPRASWAAGPSSRSPSRPKDCLPRFSRRCGNELPSGRAAAALLHLGDARLELGDLLSLRLVGVAIVARAGLLFAQRRLAMAACKRERERERRQQEKGPHSTRLSRSSISLGGRKPTTRPG